MKLGFLNFFINFATVKHKLIIILNFHLFINT